MAAMAALMVAATPAGAGSPEAGASADHLLTYLTGGKLKPGKRIAYQVVCSANCTLTASTKLKLKGPDIGPISSTATFNANVVAEAFIKPNKAARNAIKANIGAAKLVTEVTATDLTTGEIDVDNRTYRFKR